VNFGETFLTLYTRKNKDGSYRPRNIPMGEHLTNILSALCHERSPDDYVFINPKTNTRYNRRPKMMAGICKRAKIPHHGFHAIRHFVTSYLYGEKKVGKPALQQLLGHTTPTTTDIYIDSLDDNLRGPVDKLNGLLDEKPVATSSGTFKNFQVNPALFSLN
jgi:integrase